MSEEIKEILKNVRKCCEITKEQSFVVFQRTDILKLLDYIQQKESIIKEVRKYIDKNGLFSVDTFNFCNGILEILDKENK